MRVLPRDLLPTDPTDPSGIPQNVSSVFQAKPPIVPYTPQNWYAQKALYAITFQSRLESQMVSGIALNPYMAAGHNTETQMNMFVFDAIKRAQHRHVATATQHPLQTGFNISDHVVLQPAQLTLEVGMSDAIASYSVAGSIPMWELNPSKSVSAYQEMFGLMKLRQLMDINTRLETYYNMVLVDISTEETRRTYFGGLSMTLTFQQVFIADASITYTGLRIQTAKETKQGTVQPQPPSQTVIDQHRVGSLIQMQGFIPTFNPHGVIPGAGLWSSAAKILGKINPSPF